MHDPTVADLIRQLAPISPLEARRAAVAHLGRLGPAATPAITALLRSTIDLDSALREAALQALQAIDPAWPAHTETRKAIPDLADGLKSHFEAVSKAALKMLHMIGPPVVPHLADALLQGGDTTDKVFMLQILGRIGPGAAPAVPGLTQALSSKLLPARIAAATALGNIGPAAAPAVPALVAGLADQYSDGRQAMAECLARVGPTEPAIPALLPLLADRESRVRRAAAAALERIGPPVVPTLIAVIETRDAQRLKAWVDSAIKAAWWYAPHTTEVFAEPQQIVASLSWTAYDILAERDRLETAQEAALHALGRLGTAAAAAVPAITRAASDRNPDIKLAAAGALGQIGAPAQSAIPTLAQLLADRSEAVRKAAVRSLGQIDASWAADRGVVGIVTVLARQLHTAGSDRAHALSALVTIGAAAVPTLSEILQQGDRTEREHAAKALGEIGPVAKAAIPVLLHASQHDHPWVQREAIAAITKIDTP